MKKYLEDTVKYYRLHKSKEDPDVPIICIDNVNKLCRTSNGISLLTTLQDIAKEASDDDLCHFVFITSSGEDVTAMESMKLLCIYSTLANKVLLLCYLNRKFCNLKMCGEDIHWRS